MLHWFFNFIFQFLRLISFLSFQQDSNHEARPNDKTETDKRKETTIPLGAEAPTTPQKQQKSTEVSDATSSVANGDEVEGVDKEGAVAAAAPAETSSEGGVDTEKKEEAGVATTVTEPLRLVTCTQSSLVDPVEVHVEERPVHIAEPVLTPIGNFLFIYLDLKAFYLFI